MDYNKLSDESISALVAGHIFGIGNFTRTSEGRVRLKTLDGGFFEPCNNPADAWPIIENSCIGLKFLPHANEHWCAKVGRFSFMQPNPLRAAMIVFLIMQEGK